MHKPSMKKLLVIVGTITLALAAFVTGGLALSASAHAASASTLNTNGKCDPKTSQCKTNQVKLAVVVNKISGHTIQATIQEPSDKKGQAVTIITTASTVYKPDKSIVAVGKTLVVVGTANPGGSIIAQLVVHYASNVNKVAGTITAIRGSTINVQAKGNIHTILVTPNTSFLKLNPATKQEQPASRSDLKVGEAIVAVGTSNKDGSLTAKAVVIIEKGTGTK